MVCSLGVEATTRRTSCSCASVALAGEGPETRSAYGFSVGRAFDEATLLRVAHAYQTVTDWHTRRPPLDVRTVDKAAR